LTVIYLGNPDLGVVFLGYFGASLLAAAFLAIGCFFSVLTKNQVTSFILTKPHCHHLRRTDLWQKEFYLENFWDG